MSKTLVHQPSTQRAATTAIFFANGTGIGASAAAIPGFRAGLHLSDGALSLALLAFPPVPSWRCRSPAVLKQSAHDR